MPFLFILQYQSAKLILHYLALPQLLERIENSRVMKIQQYFFKTNPTENNSSTHFQLNLTKFAENLPVSLSFIYTAFLASSVTISGK